MAKPRHPAGSSRSKPSSTVWVPATACTVSPCFLRLLRTRPPYAVAHPREQVGAAPRPGGAGVGQTGAMARTGSSTVPFEEAIDASRTGDLWIFRGGSVADRLIQTASNAPVNHVGMAVVLDDLPPLMWHAELGRSLRDHWTGDHHRGVQLHDLREAVTTWQDRYGQLAWLRQISPDVGRVQEDALLRTIARLNGVSFPSTMGLAWRWLRGRDGYLSRREAERKGLRPEDAYCAEVVAVTLEAGWSYGVEVEVARASR